MNIYHFFFFMYIYTRKICILIFVFLIKESLFEIIYICNKEKKIFFICLYSWLWYIFEIIFNQFEQVLCFFFPFCFSPIWFQLHQVAKIVNNSVISVTLLYQFFVNEISAKSFCKQHFINLLISSFYKWLIIIIISMSFQSNFYIYSLGWNKAFLL